MTQPPIWDVLETLHRTLIHFEAIGRQADAQALVDSVSAVIKSAVASPPQPASAAPAPASPLQVSDTLTAALGTNAQTLAVCLANADQAIKAAQAKVTAATDHAKQIKSQYETVLNAHRSKI